MEKEVEVMISFKQYLIEEKMKDWNQYVNSIPSLKKAIEVMKILEPYGRIYIVGGAVRDLITGEKVPDDIDLACNIPMEKIESLFKTHDIGKNKDFGIIVIVYKGEDMEIAQFRSDGTYSDGRRPDSIKIEMSFEQDAERRDFTINSMAVDADGNIIDYFDGKKDVKNKVIRTVGDPNKRFSEDYLRMLRAVRFSSRMGFEMAPETLEAVKINAGYIKGIAVERVVKELMKMADQSGDKFADAILKLKESGLLKYILPEVLKMDEFEHHAEYHPEGNVWEHTLAALRVNKITDPIHNLAILLHDIGKIVTYKKEGDKITYLQHAKKGIDLIDMIADRLKLDTKTRQTLKFACEHHMKMHDFVKMSPSKIMKLVNDDNWGVLHNVSHCDDKCRLQLYDKKHWDAITDKIEKLSDKYKKESGKDPLKKIVNGQLVMKTRGIKPGKEVGVVINATMDWIINNGVKLDDTKKITDFVKNYKIA